MNFEPLYELKNRLENVAVVGINLAKDDFRLKSYMIKGLSNKYSKVINLATKKLKKQRKEIAPLQKDEFFPGVEKKSLLDWILFPVLLKKIKMIFTNIALKIGLRK